MKEMPLTKGKAAIVDDDMYEYLSQWKWSFHSLGYACRNQNGKIVLMHRVIVSAPSHLYVDHVDGNGLNNRRDNLRICTQSQNMANTTKSVNNHSGFKGVSWSKNAKKWQAQIQFNHKNRHLGYFDDPIAAAVAYNHAALRFFGEFAVFNDVPDWRLRNPLPLNQICGLSATNTSGYRYIWWREKTQKWVVEMKPSGLRIRVGNFDTLEEAVRARDKKAKELFGDFARTNFKN